MSAKKAIASRVSWGKVGDKAPSRSKLLKVIRIAARAADHSSLRPWRFIELRGKARAELGEALAAGAGYKADSSSAKKLASKPLRAPLLLAVVASRSTKTQKIPVWEQDATAAGVAHYLSLILDEEGWGVMWRTGDYTRSQAVREFHKLEKNEELLGWLYIGNKPHSAKSKPKPLIPHPELKLTTFN